MKLIKGELFNSDTDILLVTGNSYINKKGELVMGRGSALQLKEMFPDIAKIFGNLINGRREYNTLIVGYPEYIKYYGVFQVKYHFKDKADLGLISRSALKLNSYFFQYPNSTVAMNFPGIGYGNRAWDEVLPIIESLPDNVEVYYK